MHSGTPAAPPVVAGYAAHRLAAEIAHVAEANRHSNTQIMMAQIRKMTIVL